MSTPSHRVDELIGEYGADDASAAWLLCDRHDPAAVAYCLIAPDLACSELTYGALRDDSQRFAGVLRDLGVRPGDRVATLMGKSRDYLVTLVGIWRLGAVHVPLFTAFAPPAIAYRLHGSEAKVVVCDAAQRSKLAHDDLARNAEWRVVTTGPADEDALSFEELMARGNPVVDAAVLGGNAPMIQIYTSGTTGNPKGVSVPLKALAAIRSYGEFALGLGPDDTFWCAADPGWAYGLYFGVLVSLSMGVRSVFYEGGFSAEATLTILAEQNVTNFAAAPTVYRSLRSAGTRPSQPLSLRSASSAGEPLPPIVNVWAEEVLGVTIHDHYGQTETGMLINNHHHPELRGAIKPGSMGRAMPGWSATILSEDGDEEVGPNQSGRVAMRRDSSPLAWFSGYVDAANADSGRFTADGRFYLTGDTGSMDEDGDFFFSSRDDDLIIMAGYRIGPFEVEAVLSAHPAVDDCAVIAVPDEALGERMEAYVVVNAGYEGSDDLAADIQRWVKTRYAAHAYPRVIHFAEALPKTPSGKVQRFILKQRRIAELTERTAG